MPGVAVVATDRDAELERVRYPHVTEHHAAQIAHQTAHLARPLHTPDRQADESEGDAA